MPIRRHIAPRCRVSRRSRAFTLVELLIVVLVVAISAKLVVPMLQHTESTRLVAAANLLAADLSFAQSESIAHSDDLRMVVFDKNNACYSLVKTSAQSTPITNPVGKLPYQVVFGTGRAMGLNGVTISAYSLGGDDRIQFGKFGQLDQSANATVTLACSGRTIVVTIDAITGEVSIGAVN